MSGCWPSIPIMRRHTLLMSLLGVFLLPTLLGTTGQAGSTTSQAYRVLKIIDGDTFDATDGNIKFRVRIAGMDAPEKGSPFSKLATVELKNRIEGKKVEIQPVGPKTDRYNRILGQVLVDDRDVGIDMIEMGLAAYYRPGCVDYPANNTTPSKNERSGVVPTIKNVRERDKKSYDYDPRPYIAAEEKARAKKLYLWSDPKMVLPCKARKTSRR